jgi:pilus assembly protein Flp/PilA
MRAMIAAGRRFARDVNGATAIEYALIAGGVSIAIIGAVTTLGENIKTLLYDKLASAF